MRNYKTGDKYGERVINIDNKELIDLLKAKIKSIQKNPVRDLFPGLTRTYMSSKIIKFFKDNGLDDVSPTVLTKLIIQEAYRNMDPKLKETQERLAKERGHSILTQLEIYLINLLRPKVPTGSVYFLFYYLFFFLAPVNPVAVKIFD